MLAIRMMCVTACLALSGCGGQGLYQGYTFGACQQENAQHHTEHDFGGIAWCVPGRGTERTALRLID